MQTEHATPTHPVARRWPLAPAMRTLAWGILSFLGFIATLTALVWPVAQLEQVAGLAHPLNLGIWAFAWVVTSGLVVLVVARLLFREWLDVPPTAWQMLLAGAVLSAATATILADWTIARFGVNESELAGPMSLLFALIASVAVAGFGAHVAPRFAVWSPLLAVAAAAFLSLAVVVSNIPGLADGLGADSGPLAVVTLAAVAYISAVVMISLARLRLA